MPRWTSHRSHPLSHFVVASFKGVSLNSVPSHFLLTSFRGRNGAKFLPFLFLQICVDLEKETSVKIRSSGGRKCPVPSSKASLHGCDISVGSFLNLFPSRKAQISKEFLTTCATCVYIPLQKRSEQHKRLPIYGTGWCCCRYYLSSPTVAWR